MKKVKLFFSCLFSIWINGFVAGFPIWTVRRLFYRMAGMKIGKGARIGRHTQVSKPRNIVIGERTVINSDCYLDGRGGLTIENDCSISRYSKIITESHMKNSGIFESFRRPVTIRHHVWLGMNAMILYGSDIGARSIIGAGCVFKGKSDEDCIWVGNPAKLIGKRELEAEYKKDYKAFFI